MVNISWGILEEQFREARWKNCKSPVKIWEALEGKFWEAPDGGSGPKNLAIIVISLEMITLLENFCYLY